MMVAKLKGKAGEEEESQACGAGRNEIGGREEERLSVLGN
jgi:hypothetical protein